MELNIKRSSLKYQIADAIKKEIYKGKLEPGDKVTESFIAKKLEVSRGPVREAIQLLVMDGLLVSIANKETTVSGITTEEVTELLIPMRINMETYALKKGYSLWTDKHLKQFENILEQMKRATIFNDMFLFNELDIQFHELIILSSNMNNLMNIWSAISSRIQLHFCLQNKLIDLEKYTEEHSNLLDAFKSSDLDYAIETLEKHIIDTNLIRIDFTSN